MVFKTTPNTSGENGDKKQNTLPYTLQVKVVEVCLVGAGIQYCRQHTFLAVTRVAPLAARPDKRLSIVWFAVILVGVFTMMGKQIAPAIFSTLKSAQIYERQLKNAPP